LASLTLSSATDQRPELVVVGLFDMPRALEMVSAGSGTPLLIGTTPRLVESSPMAQ
jgi:hypothetical protein